MKKISCIICAYNEEERIGGVLEALNDHPLIGEVIVIDDGSTDQTSEKVKAHPHVRLIPHATNKGKSHAVATGIEQAAHDLIMLLDADLIGLSAEDITRLAEPVLTGEADISISLRKNSLFIYKIIGLDFVSGERVFSKTFLTDHLENIRQLPGFGLESYMNRLIIEHHYRVRIVTWNTVTHARKTQKIGFWKGLREEIRMLFKILKVLSLREIIYQNYQLYSLMIRRQNTPE